MRQQRFQQIIGDAVKTLIAALFAASVATAPTVAAGVPWKLITRPPKAVCPAASSATAPGGKYH